MALGLLLLLLFLNFKFHGFRCSTLINKTCAFIFSKLPEFVQLNNAQLANEYF